MYSTKHCTLYFGKEKGMNNKTNLWKWWCVFAGGKVGLCTACSYTLYSNIIHAVTLECGSSGLLGGCSMKNFLCFWQNQHQLGKYFPYYNE